MPDFPNADSVNSLCLEPADWCNADLPLVVANLSSPPKPSVFNDPAAISTHPDQSNLILPSNRFANHAARFGRDSSWWHAQDACIPFSSDLLLYTPAKLPPLFRTNEPVSELRLKMITANTLSYQWETDFSSINLSGLDFFHHPWESLKESASRVADIAWNNVITPFFNPPDTKERASLLARRLKDSGADVIFLQEVWQKEWFKRIADESGYKHGIYFGDLAQGNSDLAILSKYPLTDSIFEPLPWQSATYDGRGMKITFGYIYGVGIATLHYGAQQISIFNVHPLPRHPFEPHYRDPASRDTPERILQGLQTRDIVKRHLKPGQPAVVAGDFNWSDGQDESQVFADFFGFKSTSQFLAKKHPRPQELATFSARNDLNRMRDTPGEGVIDRFLVSPHCKIEGVQIDHAIPADSDHQKLAAEIVCTPNLPEDFEFLSDAHLAFQDRFPLSREDLDNVNDYFDHYLQNFHFYFWLRNPADSLDQLRGAKEYIDLAYQKILSLTPEGATASVDP